MVWAQPSNIVTESLTSNPRSIPEIVTLFPSMRKTRLISFVPSGVSHYMSPCANLAAAKEPFQPEASVTSKPLIAVTCPVWGCFTA